MKILRYAICFFIAFFGVHLSGFPYLVNDIPESMAVPSFFGTVLLVSLIIFAILETYLNFKKKFDALAWRVEQLEESIKDKE